MSDYQSVHKEDVNKFISLSVRMSMSDFKSVNKSANLSGCLSVYLTDSLLVRLSVCL